jgi:hypothetical protein
MQPYRTAKPHASGCDQCAPTGPGHMLCQGPDGCNEAATTQTQRHATGAEYDAIPEGLKPIDGYAVVAVFGCDDCAEDGAFTPFCEHPEAVPVPCPKCQAAGDAPCTGKNGKPRGAWHRARYDAQPQPETCTHAHRETCNVFNGCQCTGDDQPPVRTPRGVDTSGPGPDTSGLTVPVHIAQMVLAQAGHPWATVARAYSLQTQDNKPAIGADVHVYEGGRLQYDGHGHPLVQTVVVPIPLVPQGRLPQLPPSDAPGVAQ